MKSISHTPSDTTETRQSEQTGYEPDERENPVTGVHPPASRQVAPANVEDDRQVNQPPALFSLADTEPGGHFTHDARSVQQFFHAPAQDTAPIGDQGPDRQGAGAGSQDGSRRNASPPMLRLPETAGFAHESANLPFSAPATHVTESIAAAKSSASCMAGNTSDEYDLGALAAWVSSATPEYRAGHQEAEKRITAYLAAPEKHEWRLDFSWMWLLTLPPLPADLQSLCLEQARLTALPENLPPSLQDLHAGAASLSENLPRDLKKLHVSSEYLTALPENLPAGLLYLGIYSERLTALPTKLPPTLETFSVYCNNLPVLPTNLPINLKTLIVHCPKLRVIGTALPEGLQKLYLCVLDPTLWLMKLPECLKVLEVKSESMTALPPNLPEGLIILQVESKSMTALPPNMPSSLEELEVDASEMGGVLTNLTPHLRKLRASNLTAMPEGLPPGLEELEVSFSKLSALPVDLPQGLKKLSVSFTKLSELPANLPPGLQYLNLEHTKLSGIAMLDLLQARTSITEFRFSEDEVHPDMARRIKEELAINKAHPERVAKAAATLDLLTSFGFTTSDETGMLIRRDPTPDPVAAQLPAQPIPVELHDVLAANCPKEVVAVLAGMVDGAAQ